MSKVNIPKSLISRVDNSERYAKFVRRAKPIAQRMVNDYTAKQRAYAAVNTQYNRTGQIDMTRIAQVYTSDDIFIKKTIEAAGQSHGLLLVIDWSGSMQPHIESMAMQYLVTALFAKRAKIPLEVYIFTTPEFGERKSIDGLGNELSMRLILNTTTASESDIVEIFYHMICTYHSVYARITRALDYGGHSAYYSSEEDIALARRMTQLFRMGGTPLVQATSQAYMCAYRMKIRESLQNMTVLFITDGAGSRMTDGKSDAYITTLVCPFTSRRFASRIDKPAPFYRSHGMGALSAVNEMMASQGIKSINLFVGDNKHELAEVVYMVSCLNVDDDDVIRNTLHKTRSNELYDFGSIGNYTRYVALMAYMFPKIDDVSDLGDDTISNGKGTLQRRFTTSTNDTKNITRICSILVDEICADFKIKRK